MVRLTEKAVGAAPIRISMISPMPFCPSLPPCAKLTAVQVKISRERMPQGGGLPVSGSLHSFLSRRSGLAISSSTAAPAKPISGLKKSCFSTSIA